MCSIGGFRVEGWGFARLGIPGGRQVLEGYRIDDGRRAFEAARRADTFLPIKQSSNTVNISFHQSH